MYPFEVWDERTQRIEFYWNRWSEFKNELFQQYPVNHSHQRIEIDLHFPSDRIEDIPVHNWNPHHEIGNTHLSVYDYFYNNSNWSTIFEVYPQHNHNHESFRFFIEDGHDDPWGEPIKIMSTSSDIHNDSSHRFAYFRGKYWKIISWVRHNHEHRLFDLFLNDVIYWRTNIQQRSFTFHFPFLIYPFAA